MEKIEDTLYEGRKLSVVVKHDSPTLLILELVYEGLNGPSVLAYVKAHKSETRSPYGGMAYVSVWGPASFSLDTYCTPIPVNFGWPVQQMLKAVIERAHQMDEQFVPGTPRLEGQEAAQ